MTVSDLQPVGKPATAASWADLPKWFIGYAHGLYYDVEMQPNAALAFIPGNQLILQQQSASLVRLRTCAAAGSAQLSLASY